MHSLEGRRAIVCGSSQGIGRAAAHAIAELGASVVLAARNATSLNAVLETLPTSAGQEHGVIVADFDDHADVRAKIDAHIAEFGPAEILVNNTGGPPAGPLTDASPADFERAFSRHLMASQMLVQALLPGMKEAGYGRIINVTSTSVVAPIPGLGVSNTVRAAVANWARTLSGELGPYGITVNTVLPGLTDTQRLRSLMQRRAEATGQSIEETNAAAQARVPLRRFADPEEVGVVIAFLASPAAGYITGVNLPVDGGRTATQ